MMNQSKRVALPVALALVLVLAVLLAAALAASAAGAVVVVVVVVTTALSILRYLRSCPTNPLLTPRDGNASLTASTNIMRHHSYGHVPSTGQVYPRALTLTLVDTPSTGQVYPALGSNPDPTTPVLRGP